MLGYSRDRSAIEIVEHVEDLHSRRQFSTSAWVTEGHGQTYPKARHHRQVQPSHELLLEFSPVFDTQGLDRREVARKLHVGLGIHLVVKVQDIGVVFGQVRPAARRADVVLYSGRHVEGVRDVAECQGPSGV